MRELKFDLNIDSSALLNTNPTEFYSKAYITQDVVDNFRTLPGIKYETKLANVEFSNLLQASTSTFTAGNQYLSAITISVSPVSAMAEIARFDLEQSFISSQMPKGSNGAWEVSSFMGYYWDQMAQEVESEIEQIRWRGNPSNGAYTGTSSYLAQASGYEKILLADSQVVDVTLTAVTTSNVVAAMTAVVNALPAALKNKTKDLRLYVAPNVALAYKIAVASFNTLAYVTKQLDLSFLDIKIVVCEGMSANKMVLTRKDNLIYAFDGEGDGKEIKAVNLEESIAEPLLRSRVNLKIGFAITNPTEIVYYN